MTLSDIRVPGGMSIVITNWNHEAVLPRSIRSALAAVRNLRENDIECEVMVVDDGSRDGSIVLLRQLEALYYEDGLRVQLLAKNGGVVQARNHALRSVRFQHILFVDADNELQPENTFTFFRASRDTGAAVVYGNLIHRAPLGGYLNLISNESFQPHIFDLNYIDTFAFYDRFQVLDCGGFVDTEPMSGHEDWELVLHLAALGRKLVFVPVVMGTYYEMPYSQVKQARWAKHPARIAYLKRVFDQFGIRRHQPFRAHQLRYHPDIGYL